MKLQNLFFLFIYAFASALTVLTLASCASLSRSRASGYDSVRDDRAERLDRSEYAQERDSDLKNADDGAIADRVALRKAEKTLEGKREAEQYYKSKPYMRSDRERMAFLSLDSYEDRARWLTKKGIDGASTAHTAPIQALVEINDITVGMTKQAVRDSWGEPELVEVAGNPLYGNERWAYSEQLPSADGYQTEHRMVYFESGRVVGWEKK